jgi:hypothetical protein
LTNWRICAGPETGLTEIAIQQSTWAIRSGRQHAAIGVGLQITGKKCARRTAAGYLLPFNTQALHQPEASTSLPGTSEQGRCRAVPNAIRAHMAQLWPRL